MSTLQLHLHTLFVLDDNGRIISTREPRPAHGPWFSLVRSPTSCAWAVHADLDNEVFEELNRLASEEPPVSDLRQTPIHEGRYRSLVHGQIWAGPAYAFPESSIKAPTIDTEFVDDVRLLTRHFDRWCAEEIAARSPILAVIENGYAVSVCHCARRSDIAAEAGLDTAISYRGSGYGPQVTMAWAAAIRETGRTPLYSTSWDNRASLAVARKLQLVAYASNWSLTD